MSLFLFVKQIAYISRVYVRGKYYHFTKSSSVFLILYESIEYSQFYTGLFLEDLS